MKRYMIATAVLLSSQLSLAEPFAFQKAIGSSELDPSIWEGPGEVVKRGGPSNFIDSRTAMFDSANVDGDQPFAVDGPNQPSGPVRISLYEVYRDTPDGFAYSDYYDRYPADTDWPALVQEYKQRHGDV